MDKLKGIPPIQCITLRESDARRKTLVEWFQKYEITNYKFHTFERISDFSRYRFLGKYARKIDDDVKPIFISHFSVLRDWYENTDDEYLLLVEDDVSFKTVEYWNFTWEEFQNNLPDDCMCVQLVIMRYKCEPYEFDKREPNRRGHWSACAYLMKREYVNHLIKSYNPLPSIFTLEIPGIDIIPEIEQILFLDIQNRVYVFPLFVEDCYVDSTKQIPENSHKQSSHVCVMDWWKEIGKNLKINQIIK